jgi:Transposase DDE domain
VQGYNAQAVTTCQQVIVAAELTQHTSDLQQLRPMLAATTAALTAAGIPQRPATLLADCGYWSIANLTEIPDAPQLLIPPARHGRQGKPRKDGKPSASRSEGLRAVMTARLASADGKALYALRRQTIEPVFGQLKGHPWGAAVPAARAGRLRGRVEAAVRHPQPAQAVAPYPQPTGTDAACHLSGGDGRPRPPSRPAHGCPAVPATPKPHHPTAGVAGPGPSATRSISSTSAEDASPGLVHTT